MNACHPVVFPLLATLMAESSLERKTIAPDRALRPHLALADLTALLDSGPMDRLDAVSLQECQRLPQSSLVGGPRVRSDRSRLGRAHPSTFEWGGIPVALGRISFRTLQALPRPALARALHSRISSEERFPDPERADDHEGGS